MTRRNTHSHRHIIVRLGHHILRFKLVSSYAVVKSRFLVVNVIFCNHVLGVTLGSNVVRTLLGVQSESRDLTSCRRYAAGVRDA